MTNISYFGKIGLAAAAMGFCASIAAAAPINYTFTGTIDLEYDYGYDYYDAPDFDGATFALELMFDPDAAPTYSDSYNYSGGLYTYTQYEIDASVSFTGFSDGTADYSVTDLTGYAYSYDYGGNYPDSNDHVYFSVSGQPNDDYSRSFSFGIYAQDGVEWVSPETAPGLGGIISLVFEENTGNNTWFYGADYYDYYKISDLSAQSASVSAVPLPAGFALLLGGLGAFGVLGRRRKA